MKTEIEDFKNQIEELYHCLEASEEELCSALSLVETLTERLNASASLFFEMLSQKENTDDSY